MNRKLARTIFAATVVVTTCPIAFSQQYGAPDQGEPGDRMIQEYLARATAAIERQFDDDLKSLDAWSQRRQQYREEYLYMLGLWPLPDKTDLQAMVTGTVEGAGYTVEKLHYQSRPGLYVTGNVYRPPEVKAGERLPAVLYVCGHSPRGRNGNKTAFQSHGIWLARHGYVCLLVDTLQMGEIAAIHHGTSREGRWWWHARGYTSAGVECWNGVRGVDYLVSRSDVDPERIAVTGISGGGAATFWVAAADERVKVAVPVSGMADLESYVSNRVINGHCDCMFLHNTFAWPWTRIASLIAPRPMLFVNSDKDAIFPMDANERVINRLERLYSLYGAGDQVDSLVSIGGHDYRQDIRQGQFRFTNLHLKHDPRLLTDTEVDLDAGTRTAPLHAIDPPRLRVFPEDSDIPRDELNTTIDQHFVPMAKVDLPAKGSFEPWKQSLLAELRRVSFRYFPERIPAAKRLGDGGESQDRLQSEDGIELRLRYPSGAISPAAKRIVLIVNTGEQAGGIPDWAKGLSGADDAIVVCDPRGVGDTRWTQRSPPNYVARSHVLLGRTVDAGRVWDVAAAARYIVERHPATGRANLQVHAAGRGPAGLIAAYAALLEGDIASASLVDPPMTHMDPAAPQFLNILRVCDVPEMLGLLAPKPLRIIASTADERWERVRTIYTSADAAGQVTLGK